MQSSSRKRAGTTADMSTPQAKRPSDAKSRLEVICRLAPAVDGEAVCIEALDDQHVRCKPENEFTRSTDEQYFRFDKVFGCEASQSDVYKRVGYDLVKLLLNGQDALLFTYGVTGGGKTYTMTGGGDVRDASMGILPRTLDTIFNSIDEFTFEPGTFIPNGRNGFEVGNELDAKLARKKQMMPMNRYRDAHTVEYTRPELLCSVFVSYVEIYNNNCYDLLEEGNDKPTSHDIKTGQQQQVYVGGIRECEVANADEALRLLQKGDERRRVSETLLNSSSSRSHSLFIIKLVSAPAVLSRTQRPAPDMSQVSISQFMLVDLAGSERAKRTQNTGSRLAEASSINKSLLTLRRCFETLRKNQRLGTEDKVPCRESRLTYLFRSYFEGGGKIRMVICCKPTADDYEENLGVLSFGEETRNLRFAEQTVQRSVAPSANVGPPVSRRFYRLWTTTMDEWLGEQAVVSRPASSLSFQCPTAAADGVLDNEAMDRWIDSCKHRLQILNSLDMPSQVTEFNLNLRRLLCAFDYSRVEKQRLADEKENQAATLSGVEAELRASQREVVSLRRRLARYEEHEAINVENEERSRRSQREMADRLIQTERTLRQVHNLCENSTPSVAQLRQKFASHADLGALTAPERHQSRSRVKRQQTTAVVSGEYVTPKAAHTAFFDPHYHRRSKSCTGIIEHQPTVVVPQSDVLQPVIHSDIKTTRPRPDQLRRSSDYVLTHQQMDERGNISTAVVKGSCIPTAGGGTAVRFTDIEKVVHESPSSRNRAKRKT